jgi:predicted transcriptional regulator
MTDIRDELRVATAVYRSARAQRRYLMWRAAEEGGLTHTEIAELVGVLRSAVSQIIRAINDGAASDGDDFFEDEP